VEKEPWDSSTEKAKSLTAGDFGSLDEVRAMAKMPRKAGSKAAAMAILKGIASKGNLAGKSGALVSLSGKSIEKMLNDPALHQSFSIAAHWQAAANIDKLFSNAIEPWKYELNPGKNNENLKDRRYFYAPMERCERIVIVKLTVKEYMQIESGRRLYSIEAIDVDLLAKK